MTRSPVSAPNIPDKSQVPTEAIAEATDLTLWALIRHLIEKQVISADDLADRVGMIVQEIRPPNGPVDMSETGKHRFATYLALDRVERELRRT